MKKLLVLAIILFYSSCKGKSTTLTESDMSAYLMVYFKDDTHSLYMAVSEDGYTFIDINKGMPIISGDTIAMQKGIRDPHIYRGPDNAFYLAMTDLHIYAREKGFRQTEWERDNTTYGWGNNQGFVLMKSTDLIHWTLANVKIADYYPELKELGCAWAPQTIYDEQKQKLMLYFTMRLGNGNNRLYYSYVNNDFNRLESAPQLLFEYPKDISYIDADIIKVGDHYHMFYTPHDGTPGIKQAVSTQSAHAGYIYDPLWCDPEPRSCEAPNVWKRIGEDKWVLMYDVYGVVPPNFGFCETTDFKTFSNIGRFNEGVMKSANFVSPKHGAVMHITKGELDRLEKFWNSDLTETLTDKEKVSLDVQALGIPDVFMRNNRWNLPLDSMGKQGSTIRWKSDNPNIITHRGRLLKLSPRNEEHIKVKMTATVTFGNAVNDKSFTIHVAYQEPEYTGYLFTYFEGSGEKNKQEQLRFGVSADAINWYALNNNEPIIASDTISSTGGIRDPHILRGEDHNTFYMVATDMFTIRDGWETNPGIVLMKSSNLIDWTHSFINLEKEFPSYFQNVKWVWAPQTIYDPVAARYLVYFTVRLHENKKLDFYCAYANKEFTMFETVPKLMFSAKNGAIDGDIIYKDGIFHFFYKGNTKDEEGKEFENGIQQAIGKSLQGPWTEEYKYLDAYSVQKVPVEGSSIFKLNNSNEYVLMYDLYRHFRFEFQQSSDLYHFSQPQSFTKNFNPRHGSVMSITKEEAARLNKKWSGVPDALLKK